MGSSTGRGLGSHAAAHSVGKHPDVGNCWADCLVRRSCDVAFAPAGEDAFYREAFYDCDEGDGSHDHLFAKVLEVARLKMHKGKVIATCASYGMQEAGKEIGQCMFNQEKSQQKQRKPRDWDVKTDGDNWLGCTVREWTGNGHPPAGEGPYWAKSTGAGLMVRCGPNYIKSGNKVEANGSMYKTMCLDMIKARHPIHSIMGTFIKHPPRLQEYVEESDGAAGTALRWSPDCPLPRVICLNLMFPYESGLNPFGGHDPGFSCVCFQHIKPETIQLAKLPNPPPHIKLFKEFCDAPCGQPGSPVDCSARSLATRLKKGAQKHSQGGIFKGWPKILNLEEVLPVSNSISKPVRMTNGKPLLFAKCAYIVKDPNREWIEIGADLRGFNPVFRKILTHLMSTNICPLWRLHFGWAIQGVEDTELPEGLIGEVLLHGFCPLQDPVYLDRDS